MGDSYLFELWGVVAVSVLVVVFVSDFIGNMISFSNRFVNALVTALVFALLFGLAQYYVADMHAPLLVAVGAFLVFCSDLVSNMFTFKSRFTNALLTAVLSTLVFGSVIAFYLS